MRDLLLLSKILLKNNYTPLSKNGKKKSLALRTFLLVLCELPFALVLYVQFDQLFASGMTTLGLQAGFVMGVLLSLFTVLFAFPTVFYFSRDISFLLPLPVPSWTIVGAKFIVVLISQVMVALTIMVPMCLAWMLNGCGSFLQGILLVVQSLIVPLDTLLILGILTIALMAFLPGVVNKDRFNLVMGLAALIFAMCISMVSSSTGASVAGEATQSDLVVMMQQNPELMEMSTGMFFQCLMAVKSIGTAAPSLLWTLLSFGAFTLLLALFLFMAARLYIPSASAAMMKVSGSKKKGKTVRTSAARSYLLNRFRLLYRTPAYVTNLLFASILMPLMLLVMTYALPVFKELQALTSTLEISEFMPEWALMLLIGLICGFFHGSTNGICSTSFSRDGQNLGFYKSIPMDMKEQMRLRLLIGFIPSLVGVLMMIPIFHLFITYNPVWDLLYILGASVTTLITCQIGLLIDACHPKLVWDDETASVKNNYNSLYELFLSWIILAIVAVPTAFLIQVTPWASVIALVICAVMAVIMEHFVETNGASAVMKA